MTTLLKSVRENRTTIFQVLQALNITNFTALHHAQVSAQVFSHYTKIAGEQPIRVNQKRIFGKCKYKKKVASYPEEYVPVMINIIKAYFKEHTTD
jgi:hypothetical protein